MYNDTEKLQRAKMFMDYLANGVDPVTNADADAGTLRNEQVISCFRYVSDILARNIHESENTLIRKKRSEFFITDEQRAGLMTHSYECKVSELAAEINRVTEENHTKRLTASWINDWLEAEGYLGKSDLKSRITTEKGIQLGITSEYRKSERGTEYYVNLFTEQAQAFVFDHLNDMIEYRNRKKDRETDGVRTTEYPAGLSVKEFIRRNSDKCFIMSVGSCDTVAEVGSYLAVLYYKGKSKLLKATNIPAESDSRCMLYGMLAAASSIKSPTEVMLLSSTPLGFDSPQSRSCDLCEELYHTLADKGCSINAAVCQGKGNELNSFIRSFDSPR